MNQKTILLVDDDSNIRRLLSFLLERTGSKVFTAVDGVDGLERAKAVKPNLVITDAMMPNKNGFELCSDLRKDPELAGIKIIMLTARDQAMTDDMPGASGANLCLTKPFNPMEITRIVKEMLAEQP
jgi:two-component system, OmpR family, alkaline phosphatase synthesis response regulator PhoP